MEVLLLASHQFTIRPCVEPRLGADSLRDQRPVLWFVRAEGEAEEGMWLLLRLVDSISCESLRLTWLGGMPKSRTEDDGFAFSIAIALGERIGGSFWIHRSGWHQRDAIQLYMRACGLI